MSTSGYEENTEKMRQGLRIVEVETAIPNFANSSRWVRFGEPTWVISRER